MFMIIGILQHFVIRRNAEPTKKGTILKKSKLFGHGLKCEIK